MRCRTSGRSLRFVLAGRLGDRPTGEPQLGQFRFSSGTCGFFMIAWAGSITGAGGTRVSPAPSRADRSRWEPERTRLVILEPSPAARCEPSAVDCSRAEPPVIAETAPPVDSGA